MDKLTRFRGSLLGLAAADAVGTTLEFKAPGSFKPISDMVGGGPFGLLPGQWTDDTSMALCLAESLIQKRGFDARDQIERYVRWYHGGYWSSTGRCFDIGNTVRGALQRFLQTNEPFSGSTDPYAAGNGSIMRLAPIPMFFVENALQALEMSGESSRTTHGAETAVSACRYFGGLILGALQGTDKVRLLAPHYSPVPGYWQQHPLHPAITAVAAGSFKDKEPPAIKGSGYVVESLEAALWAFYNSSSFHEGCLLAANLGDDADTTAAVYGQLAGAFYGLEDIPANWRTQVARQSDILSLADQLYELSQEA